MKHHHISAVPDGYLVRVTRGGKTKQIFIAGGRSDALAGAIRARDKLLAGTPQMDYEAGRPIAHVVARSNTGLPGLSYTVSKKGNSTYPVIKASVRIRRGVTQGRTFFLHTYGGYDEALLMAWEWREEILEARRRRKQDTSTYVVVLSAPPWTGGF
jgi:hypothetical protein